MINHPNEINNTVESLNYKYNKKQISCILQ
jgi:UDP-N-acetylmuramate-alanine ligase